MIDPDEDSSFRVLYTNVPVAELKWGYHYHPEIEIVCITGGTGTRHVGYHKSNFLDGDLVLIGSNIPHSGFGLNATDSHEEIVIQFDGKIIEPILGVNEIKGINKIIEDSKYGITFSSEIRKKLLPKLKKIISLRGFERYVILLEILFELSQCDDYKLLNKEVMPYSIVHKHKERLQKIFTYIEKNYQNEIDINTVAELVHLTSPAFCNFFKNATKMTFTEYANRFRINKSCLFIIQGKSIIEASYGSGFNNVTYFNKIFKKYIKKTPTEFIKEYHGL